MLLGVVADDFTGASDIANTLAKGLPNSGGLVVTQYMGIPTEPADQAVLARQSQTPYRFFPQRAPCFSVQ